MGKVPVSVDNVFRIGSLTKPLTATLVMRLAEIGVIDLDGTVAGYLPAEYGGTAAGKRKGQIDAAVQVMRRNAERSPASPNVHDSLAEALLASGDREGARAGYARVLALDPGNRHAAEELEKLQRVPPVR